MPPYITLTVQYKRSNGTWEDDTIVVVLNASKLELEIATLVAELPKNISARIKVDTNGSISYRW